MYTLRNDWTTASFHGEWMTTRGQYLIVGGRSTVVIWRQPNNTANTMFCARARNASQRYLGAIDWCTQRGLIKFQHQSCCCSRTELSLQWVREQSLTSHSGTY